MITAFIVGCEIAFWLFVLAGLYARYILRQRRLGTVLLLCTPLVDVALLVATVLELRGGGTASFAHGLAAIYIGVSVAFGHAMIRWADVRFAHRFAGSPAPVKPPKGGPEHARRERILWLRHLGAYVIGCAILLGMVLLVGDATRTESLRGTLQLWSLVLVIDFVWSFSYTFWQKKAS